jgi:hypothetical protein
MTPMTIANARPRSRKKRVIAEEPVSSSGCLIMGNVSWRRKGCGLVPGNPENATQRGKIPVRKAMTHVEKVKTPAILTAKMFSNQ